MRLRNDGMQPRYAAEFVGLRQLLEALSLFVAPPLPMAHYIQPQTGKTKRAKQPKSIHITQDIEIPLHQNEDENRDASCQHNRVMRRSTPGAATFDKTGKETHARERQEDMVRANNGGVTSKNEQCRRANGNQNAQHCAVLAAKQGDILRGIWR